MTSYRSESSQQASKLWTRTHDAEGRPDWTHLYPYYADDLRYRDPIQEIHGIEEFRSMTARLADRSRQIHMRVIRHHMRDNDVLLEWEMTVEFKNRPPMVICGVSRLTLNGDGRITEQRDCFDIWGDVMDNIPVLARQYRKFMRKKFGKRPAR